MNTFINFSNHPSDKWEEKQLNAAKNYGEVVDLPFTNVNPSWSKEDVQTLAKNIADDITGRYSDSTNTVVMVQGEMTLVFALVSILKGKGYTCVASTTERISYVDEQGNKVSKFEFCQFREY